MKGKDMKNFEEFRSKTFNVGDFLDASSKIIAKNITEDGLPASVALIIPIIIIEILRSLDDEETNDEETNDEE